jgi:hypothetical protein
MKTKAPDPAPPGDVLARWKEIGPDGNAQCWGKVAGMAHICGGALDSKGICAVCAGWMAARNQPPGYDLALERIATALERIALAFEASHRATDELMPMLRKEAARKGLLGAKRDPKPNARSRAKVKS